MVADLDPLDTMVVDLDPLLLLDEEIFPTLALRLLVLWKARPFSKDLPGVQSNSKQKWWEGSKGIRGCV